MRDQFRPAIEALQQDLQELDRKIVETKTTINRLCELAGEKPLYADVAANSGQPTLGAIQADTFYGKVIITASREYLEMRRNAGLGPVSPREIYEALKKGGFRFDTKIENNAITGVRNTLRKASNIFHRLPTGEYGLLKWYPRAKEHDGAAGRKGKKRRGRPRKVAANSVQSTAPRRRGRLPTEGATPAEEAGDS